MRMAKWLTIMEDRVGVGLNKLQLTTRMSTSVGLRPAHTRHIPHISTPNKPKVGAGKCDVTQNSSMSVWVQIPKPPYTSAVIFFPMAAATCKG